MAWAVWGASHFPPLAGAQGSGPEAESRPGRERGRDGKVLRPSPCAGIQGQPG